MTHEEVASDPRNMQDQHLSIFRGKKEERCQTPMTWRNSASQVSIQDIFCFHHHRSAKEHGIGNGNPLKEYEHSN
jgi:hypothetical protein